MPYVPARTSAVLLLPAWALGALAAGPASTPARPVAGLLLNPSTATVGQPVAIDARGTAAAAGLARLTLTFGDGTVARLAPSVGLVRHVYRRPGNYAVTLTVKDRSGRTASQVRRETVRPAVPGAGLDDPAKKDTAMRLVSSAENSSLDWRAQFRYIEDIGDGRGYTGGIIGFTSGTGDMLDLVRLYTQREPGNALGKYLNALTAVNGTASHAGLDDPFTADWHAAANDPVFTRTQEDERDRVYFNPAVALAKKDGLRALGQFGYYDAAVVHGYDGLLSVRAEAARHRPVPSAGGDETAYLEAFLDARVLEMYKEAAHSDTSRIDTAQRAFLRAGNLDLTRPLSWHVYGDPYALP